MEICDTFNADRDVAYLAVSLTFLFGMSRTLKKIKLYCTICERNNVVGSRRKFVNMFVDAFSTKTNLAGVADCWTDFAHRSQVIASWAQEVAVAMIVFVRFRLSSRHSLLFLNCQNLSLRLLQLLFNL